MVKQIKLEAAIREEKNGTAKEIIRNGYLPAVLYGADIKNTNLKVKKTDFEKIYEKAGESTLIDLAVGDEPEKVLIKDVQKDPVKGIIIHIDFYKVDMNKEIEVEIPINFVGEAPAVKEFNATLVKNMDTITAKCLPGNLIENIEVDLSGLKSFDDYIRIGDLKVPETIELTENPEEVIANVMEAKVEEFAAPQEVPAEGEIAEGEEGKETKAEGDSEKSKE